MISPAHEISLHLAAILNETVYAGGEPPSPDNTVTVYDTGGDGPDTDQLDIDQPEFQVRVRDVSYVNAYSKQSAIKHILIDNTQAEMSTSIFSQIDMTMEISSLGRDESNRYILVATYRGRRSAIDVVT